MIRADRPLKRQRLGSDLSLRCNETVQLPQRLQFHRPEAFGLLELGRRAEDHSQGHLREPVLILERGGPGATAVLLGVGFRVNFRAPSQPNRSGKRDESTVHNRPERYPISRTAIGPYRMPDRPRAAFSPARVASVASIVRVATPTRSKPRA